jgi:uncharacterized protein (DUF3820 family)
MPGTEVPIEAQHCSRCSSTEKAVTRYASGPHYARAKCLNCGKVTFLKKPWTLERALEFNLPWGKYRGRMLLELTDDPAGRDYLRWLAREVHGNAGIAAGIVLDHVETTCSDVSSSRKRKPAGVGAPAGLSDATPPLPEARASHE